MTQPTLRTARIELVPLEDEHLEHEVELDSDPEVVRYLFARPRTRIEVEEAHRHRLASAEPIPGLGFWCGFVNGKFVGGWMLQPLTEPQNARDRGDAGLGYRLLRRYWRQGLASEGARELLRYGFDDLGLRRILAQTMAVNEGSRAVMTSIGLTHLRTFQVDFEDPLPGTELGEVEYGITRARWQAGPTL